MPLPEEDLVRLKHMRDVAREARGYIAGRSRSDLDTDGMLLRALDKCLEIIGEAATRVGPATRQLAPHIPRTKMMRRRNRLAHACFYISVDVIWSTVHDDVPELIAHLEKVNREHGLW